MDAFRSFLVQLLDVSGAVPLPNPEAARGTPFQIFSALADYEQEVLGVISA